MAGNKTGLYTCLGKRVSLCISVCQLCMCKVLVLGNYRHIHDFSPHMGLKLQIIVVLKKIFVKAHRQHDTRVEDPKTRWRIYAP
ncbi:hypothetical protein L1987_73997 [Smallanthus sonchifolius]|uniref:Uncharacterized protein n=1 Tax=Smallanthus sonchifolius TaxID=185202 RepID=A0ACB9A103_9ASTR|nr:hypothetical protein L1987_73997 [Smallanthus sonchifolius]